jgi:hemolysin activation/secretion protein
MAFVKASFKLIGVVGLLASTGNVWAELPPLGGFLPGAARPEQVSKALQTEAPKPQHFVPPSVTHQEPAKPAANEQMQKIKFQLNQIILEGNHVYTNAQLQHLYANKLHKTITVADLFTIVQSITNYYRNNGYILSRALLPPQHVKNGIVKVQIIEGYIGKVAVSGTPNYAKCQVMRLGMKIEECKPLQLSRMEKYLILANELPGTQVKAVLSPSKTAVGAADMTLVTQNKIAQGYLSYDNYGTRYIGPQQITANYQLNSFIASGDATQITVTKTPKGGELTFIDINTNRPVDDNGTRWLLGATRAHTHPLFVLRPAQVDGLNNNYYTTVQWPLIRTRTRSLTLRAGFNYLDSEVTAFSETLYTDHIRSFDLGAGYNFSDRWYGSNLLSGDFRQGLPILGYTSNQNPNTAQTSRPGGRGDYTKVALTASRLQVLKGPFSLYGIFQGQWAFNPLLASEQFSFGGSQLGRGYDIAEILGDKGVAGSAELRFDQAVGKFLIQSLQFYTFYDAGIVWNFKFIGGVPRKQSGTSTGLGVRFFMNRYISGNLMWTQPLTKQVSAMELIGEGRRPRVFFSVVASFG